MPIPLLIQSPHSPPVVTGMTVIPVPICSAMLLIRCSAAVAPLGPHPSAPGFTVLALGTRNNGFRILFANATTMDVGEALPTHLGVRVPECLDCFVWVQTVPV